MPKGYNGKILRVNLSKRKTMIEEPSQDFYRRYMGGRALALYYLLREVSRDADSFAPDNKIVFAASVITGAPIPGMSRHSVVAKSPLTNAYGESEAGGYWGVELKSAGFDAIIVEGKADNPVYLWVHDGEVEIKSAEDIWGKDTGEAQEIIREEIGEEKARVAIIGPAGENMVRFACIVNDLKHVNGRCGLGAVMGSKNLKAIAVKGRNKLETAYPDKVKKLAKFFADNFRNNADNSQLNKFGTSQYFLNCNAAGTLPTKNFQAGSIEGAEKIGHEILHNEFVIGSEGCYACPVRCKRICKFEEEPYKIDPIYGGPEFESITALGSNCGVTDIKAVVKANELCNRYGLDTISTGNVIAFSMECVERGIIPPEQLEGVNLNFGNGSALVQMVEKIAKREGIGNILAEGVKRLSEKLGQESEKFAMQAKGLEYAMHEPRGKYGVGLAYAIGPFGADHLQHEHDGAFDPLLTGYSHKADEPGLFSKEAYPLGLLEPVKTLSIGPEKVRLFTYLQHWWSLFNCLEICIFVFAPVRTFKIPQIIDIVRAVTGWETSLWELMKLGERATTMARAFNIKHGLTKEDDKLAERTYEPLGAGAMKGSKVPKEDFLKAISIYYEMMGWDRETGIPTFGKLAELDISWVADEIGLK